jgi:hypothetical protein
MHVSEQVEEELKRNGWKKFGAFWRKRIDNFEEAGMFSDGARIVNLSICESGRWLERKDGWGKFEKDVDLRGFIDNPQGAIEEVLK